jgi:hypothetical protein
MPPNPAQPGTHNALLTHKYESEISASQEGFMMRNHVAPTYHGPVFVVEDVWVPCSLCNAPVDPVVRIPVGKQWFHPQCLRCAVCARPSRTDAFRSVKGQPVCSDCFGRGFDKALHPLSRHSGGGLLAGRGSSSRASSRNGSVTPRRALSPIGSISTPMRISATPSAQHRILSTPFLDSRSITKRQAELLERQRLFTQGDSNILLLAPVSSQPKCTVASTTATPTLGLHSSPIGAITFHSK